MCSFFLNLRAKGRKGKHKIGMKNQLSYLKTVLEVDSNFNDVFKEGHHDNCVTWFLLLNNTCRITSLWKNWSIILFLTRKEVNKRNKIVEINKHQRKIKTMEHKTIIKQWLSCNVQLSNWFHIVFQVGTVGTIGK